MSTQTIASDPRSDIEAGNRRFMEAFRRGDAASVAQLYTATGQLLPAHSEFIDGTRAIQRFWQGAMDMGIKEAVLETVEVEGHGETAHEVGRYSLKTGTGEVADSGKYLVVWKHEDGVWKLHRDIWTTSRPSA